MGRKSQRKGYYGEWKLVNKLHQAHIEATRVPLSGAVPNYYGDIHLEHTDEIMEVKVRRNGFKSIYEWLGDSDYLAIKQDRHDYLIVMTFEKFCKLYRAAYYGDIIRKDLKRR